MMTKNILVVSAQKSEENALSEWTSAAHPFQLHIVDSDEAAIELFQRQQFDMVVVDDTDNSINTGKLHAVLPILQGEATLLKYQGETETQLRNNVEAVFSAKKYQRLQRLLLIEPSVAPKWSLPPFSLN